MFQYEGKRVIGPNGERGIIRNGQLVIEEQPAAPEGIRIGNPDPRRALDLAKGQNDLRNAPLDTRSKELENELREQQIRNAQLEEQQKRQAMSQGGGGAVTAETRGAAQAKVAAARSLGKQLDRVEQMFNQTLGQGRSVGEYLPTEENKTFDAAVDGMMPLARQAFRVPGSGSDTEREAQYIERILPDRFSFDGTNRQRIDQLRQMIRDTETEFGPIAGERQPAPKAPEQMDRTQQQIVAPSGGRVALSKGATFEDDPALKGVRDRYLGMLGAGKSEGEIVGYLRSVGISDPKVFSSVRQQIQFRRKNPGVPLDKYDAGAIDDRAVPMSVPRQALNLAAQSPVGSYFANAADALSMGTLDNMTDNPALTRAGMRALQQENPNASLAGTVTGGLLAAGGIEAGLGRAGLSAGRAAIGSDLLFGGAYGAGSSDEGNRAMGALTGAAAARAGGYAGSKVAAGVGRVATGARDAGTRYLTERGIPLTLGQMAGQGGRVGRTVKALEDKLESLPWIGEGIRARRMEGYEALNREAFNQALQPIGGSTGTKIAEEGVEAAFDQTTDAYKQALRGVTVNGNDQVFIRTFSNAAQRGQRLPGEMREHFDYMMKEHVVPRFDKNGNLTGDAYQDIRRALREERAAWKSKPRGRDYGNAIASVEKSLEHLVRRQAPQAIPMLNKADAAYRRAKVVQGAVSAAKNKGGVFSPAQLGNAAEANAKKFGGSATTDRPFFELQRNAQDILPSEVPNSGTTDRALALTLLPGALGGAGVATGIMDPSTAIMLGSFGLPYTRSGANIIQKAATARPEFMRQAGEELIKRKRIGGLFGAPLALPFIPQ